MDCEQLVEKVPNLCINFLDGRRHPKPIICIHRTKKLLHPMNLVR